MIGERPQQGESADPDGGGFRTGRRLAGFDLAKTLMIKRGSLVALSGTDGSIDSGRSGEQGLYFHDTRFLGRALLEIEGRAPIVVRGTDAPGDSMLSELENPELTLPDGSLLERGALRLRRRRTLNGHMSEVVTVCSFATQEVHLRLAMTFDSDFTTLFGVRGSPPSRRGRLHGPTWMDRCLELRYDGADGRRRTTTFAFSPAPDEERPGRATWHLRLEPGQEVAIRVVAELRDRGPGRLEPTPRSVVVGSLGEVTVESDWRALDLAIRRSLDDLTLLAMHEQQSTFFAAGVPWFVALFGRDSLITALQTLAFDPSIAATTLELLAAHQGRERNAWRDEEPGKILHELRVGEDANLGEIPHTPYYGTVDATPLFVVLLGEYVRWTGDLELWRRLLPNAERAIEWMLAADHDGDGFVDYEPRSTRGLANQGWKDSPGCIVNRDGSRAEPPIALVEVQGYVYRALLNTAWLYRLDGRAARAAQLETRAADLQRRFEDAYWMPDRRFLALALQGGGSPVEAIASNAGQALWSGIVRPDRGSTLAARLLRPDLFSGWGVRSLAEGEAGYDPEGYHVGAVWPHDNALIVSGLAEQGYAAAAAGLFGAQLAAAAALPAHRLPEAFSGRARRPHEAPLPYPAACVPQAWSSGALLYMLTQVLGLVPDAMRGVLHVRRPVLPRGVRFLTVRGVRVGPARLDLRFVREGGRVQLDVLRQVGSLHVRTEL